MKKKYIIGIILAVVVLSFFLFKGNNDERELITVNERELVKEVFESGAVKSGDNFNLSFQSGGTVEDITVSEGQLIERGQLLASLDKQDLLIRRRQALQKIEMAQAELSLVREGGRDEEITALENRLLEAEEALSLAQRSLQEANEKRDTELNNVYSKVPSSVNRSYLLAKELKDSYKNLRDQYFVGFYLQDTYKARSAINRIERSYEDLRNLSRDLTVSSDREKIDQALIQAEKTFSIIEEAIEEIIDISESDFYERRFSDVSRNFLWSTKKEASDMLSAIVTIRGEIKSAREALRGSVTQAESSLSAARARRNEIKDNLEQIKLGGRDAQVRAAEAAFEAANEDLRLLDRQIERADIKSPVSGRVVTVHSKPGEEVAPGTPVVTVLSEGDFHVEVDIYEGDIPVIELGNKATIEFVPFPRQSFTGEVISINETGKVINGVVYFEVSIGIDNPPERLMTEMTADVNIEVERKKTISLPREAIRRDGIERYVKVLDNGEEKRIDVEIGITDSYGFMEILSGLSEGDQVLVD